MVSHGVVQEGFPERAISRPTARARRFVRLWEGGNGHYVQNLGAAVGTPGTPPLDGIGESEGPRATVHDVPASTMFITREMILKD